MRLFCHFFRNNFKPKSIDLEKFTNVFFDATAVEMFLPVLLSRARKETLCDAAPALAAPATPVLTLMLNMDRIFKMLQFQFHTFPVHSDINYNHIESEEKIASIIMLTFVCFRNICLQ
jgi:hypothetical protein